mgnify:CR=1 FL=1
MNGVINKDSKRLKIGILSISTLLTAAGAVSGTVPMMAKQFSDQSSSQIQALITIPSIGMMIFILLSSLVIKMIGKRNTVLIGLFLGLIGGILPFFTDSFRIIQIARFIFGAGNGLYSTSTASLIGDLYKGDEQRTLLGIQSAVQTLGNSVATFMAGIFLGISWHSAYLVYLIFVPVIFLFATSYTPRVEKAIKEEQQNSQQEKVEKSHNVPVLALVAILMSFVYFNAIMPAQTNGALVIMQLKMSNQAFFSTSLSIAGIAGALVTSLYGKIYKIFRHYTPVFIMALGVVGYLGMVHSKNMLMYTLFMIIATSTSLIFPYIYGAVMEDVPASAKDFTLSIAKVFNNFGAFLSPYTMAFTAQLLGKHDAVSIFNIAAGYMVFIGIVFIVLALLRNANNHKEIK